MSVSIGGVSFEKVVEVINAQAAAIAALTARIETLDRQVSFLTAHRSPPV